MREKILLCLILSCAPLHADDDRFRERFADPATRTAALAELIPGTRSAYFHTALDHQLAGREAEFRQTLADWKAAAERKENPVSAESMKVLENRRLNLKFTDTRPDAAAAAESLPTRVAEMNSGEIVFHNDG